MKPNQQIIYLIVSMPDDSATSFDGAYATKELAQKVLDGIKKDFIKDYLDYYGITDKSDKDSRQDALWTAESAWEEEHYDIWDFSVQTE